MHRRSFLAGTAGALAVVSCGAGGEGAREDAREGPRAWSVPAKPVAVPPLSEGHRLEALGGLELDNGAIGFGGFSALHLDEDLRLTAVSDLARWMTARLVLRDGKPAGLSDLRTGRLRDGSGQPLARGYGGDAEGLARLPDGSWLVSFERWHRLRAFRGLNGPGTYVEAPPGLDRAPLNGGVEALAVLADGAWFLVTEAMPGGAADPRLRRAWLGGPGAWKTVSYRAAEDFDPADATALPGGGALVLERRFSLFGGFAGRLVRLTAAQLRGAEPGAVLEGEEILRLAPPLPTDNYEAIAATRHGDRTFLAVLADDNENMLQRSLLLLFACAER